MSYASTEWQPNLEQAAAQAETAMGQAVSAAAAYQDEAHTFIVENGAAVVDGQTQVGHPNVEGGAGDVGEGGMFGGAGNSDY